VTDSRVPAIYAYDHDPLTGVIDSRKVFATFRPADGFPDGLLVDDDGTIWSTLFDGGTIQQIGSDGRFGQRIELPVSRPTSCCFSADRQLLYVTTARLGLAGEQMKREPLAGALLAVQMV
jgi:sugar lactone lactonase YvrE